MTVEIIEIQRWGWEGGTEEGWEGGPPYSGCMSGTDESGILYLNSNVKRVRQKDEEGG